MKEYIDMVREQEKLYHDHLYSNFNLWEKGSWLYKPVKEVIEWFKYIVSSNPKILDLWWWVWRHTIPLAQKIQNNWWEIVCVDLLESAKVWFERNVKKYWIKDWIARFVLNDLDNYNITQDTFDYILAISILEHLESKESLIRKLKEMIEWTKSWWVHCIVMSTENKLFNTDTKESRDAPIEINLQFQEMQAIIGLLYTWRFIYTNSTTHRSVEQPQVWEYWKLEWKTIRLLMRKE